MREEEEESKSESRENTLPQKPRDLNDCVAILNDPKVSH